MPSEIGFLTGPKEKIKSEEVKGENDKDILLERLHGSASWQEGSLRNLSRDRNEWEKMGGRRKRRRSRADNNR